MSRVSKMHEYDNAACLEKEVKLLKQQRAELLEALKHLKHNAIKSGANMGMAIDIAESAIKKSEQ